MVREGGQQVLVHNTSALLSDGEGVLDLQLTVDGEFDTCRIFLLESIVNPQPVAKLTELTK